MKIGIKITIVGLLVQMTQAANLPNIVFVLNDDLGIGDVSTYNSTQSAVETANIDKLAEGGIKFTNGHTSTAICSPTRYSIQTGDHSYHIGKEGSFENNYSEDWFPANKRSIADIAKLAGYKTAYVGKWHIGYTVYNTDGSEMARSNSSSQSPAPDWSKGISDHPTDHGYDYAFGHTSSADIPPYKYFENDQWVSSQAQWITKALALSSGIADRPGDGTDVATIRNGWMDPNWDFNQIQRTMTDKALGFIKTEAPNTDSVPFFLFFGPSGPHTPNVPHPDFQGKTPHNYTDYVFDIDAMVGELVAELKAQNVYNNTIIIVTSDNGANRGQSTFNDHRGTGRFGTTNIRGQKGTIFEGGHRVPLVMHWGDDTPEGSVVQPGIVTNELISTQDFFRSFAALWNVPLTATEGVDSWNMLPVFYGDGSLLRIREANFANSHQRHFAVTKQFDDGTEWKLIFSTGSGGWDNPVGTKTNHNQAWGNIDISQLQLYNLTADLGEQDNVLSNGASAAETAIAQELHDLMFGYWQNAKSNTNDPDSSRGWTPPVVPVVDKMEIELSKWKIFKKGNVIIVELSDRDNESLNFELRAANGQLIAQQRSIQNRVMFNIGAQDTGILFLKVRSGQSNFIRKIMI